MLKSWLQSLSKNLTTALLPHHATLGVRTAYPHGIRYGWLSENNENDELLEVT